MRRMSSRSIRTLRDFRNQFSFIPGAAEAVEQSGVQGKVLVTGLSTPNDMKKFVANGTVRSVVLWNTVDLGYLTVYAAEALATGKLQSGATFVKAGRLGDKTIAGDHILLGDIIVFTKDNMISTTSEVT